MTAVEPKKFYIRVVDEPSRGKMSLYIMMKSKDGEMYRAKPLVFEKADIYESDPVLELSTYENDQADAWQELADSLAVAGIIQRSRRGTAGQLEAINYHLEDMRRLVFGTEDSVEPDKD